MESEGPRAGWVIPPPPPPGAPPAGPASADSFRQLLLRQREPSLKAKQNKKRFIFLKENNHNQKQLYPKFPKSLTVDVSGWQKVNFQRFSSSY